MCFMLPDLFGRLIGLAAVTVGLTSEAAQHLEEIVRPTLNHVRRFLSKAWAHEENEECSYIQDLFALLHCLLSLDFWSLNFMQSPNMIEVWYDHNSDEQQPTLQMVSDLLNSITLALERVAEEKYMILKKGFPVMCLMNLTHWVCDYGKLISAVSDSDEAFLGKICWGTVSVHNSTSDTPTDDNPGLQDVISCAHGHLETISTLSETLRFTYSETLGKWPIGDLAFGINFLLKRHVGDYTLETYL